MILREIAHARAGDKGNIVTISLIAYRQKDFSLLEEKITVERVGKHFAEWLVAPVERYSVQSLGALNFVLQRSQAHSVTRSLALDAHGKCLGSALLAMEI